ncbi:MAG: rRNA maturation RNase YbeY [Gammaproteobacteria bacterium]|nr:rRNA maturation RNase YbeY [Gammaproteobacteria bacterium]
MGTYYIDLQFADLSLQGGVPPEEKITQWVETVLAPRRDEAELSIRIVDNAEIQSLNKQFRHQDKPTNVLSFPADLPEGLDIPLLGDVVIAAPVVEAEAIEQGKAIEAHWCHMVVHGVLHLLGYDHIDENEAIVMESLETGILTGLGYEDPYETG